MLKIDVHLNRNGIMKISDKSLVYSTVTAINDTLLQVQKAQRAAQRTEFTIRKPDFMDRLVMVKRANVRSGKLYGDVLIASRQNLLLQMFEEGGIKQPVRGSNVAVPLTGEAARPSFGDTIKDTLTFKGMRFKKHRTRTGKIQWEGQNGTFLIPGIGVFQRQGGTVNAPGAGRQRGHSHSAGHRGRDPSVRLIYAFKKAVRLPKRMHFVELATGIYNTSYLDNLRRQFILSRR